MKTILSTFLTFITLLSFSQIQNEKGTIIINGKDTITGSITYYDDFLSSVTIIDSNNIENKCTIDCINDIILNNGIRYTSLDYGNNGKDKVFVQTIIGSDLISLYSSEENGVIYFYAKKDNTVFRLENNSVFTEIDKNKYEKQKYLSYDYKYMGSLKVLMSDKPQLFEKIDKLKLNEQELTDIILEYNLGNNFYIMPSKVAKSKTVSNWVAFANYCNHRTYYGGEPTNAFSYGMYAGGQLYFGRSRRHSFKIALGYSHYQVSKDHKEGYGVTISENYTYDILDLEFSYEYVFFMTNHSNIYARIHVADFALTKEKNIDNASTEEETDFRPVPRFSPGLGYEFKTKQRLSFFVEINHLFNLEYLPFNYSFGLKYDIGKVVR